MKKAILVIIIAALLGTVANAQRQTTPAPVTTHEVSVGYGLLTVTDFVEVTGKVFASIFGAAFGARFEDNHLLGAFNAGYTYKVSRMVNVGGIVSYSQISGTIRNVNSETARKATKNFYSVMPQAKFNWYSKGFFTIYSRVAAGVMVMDLNEKDLNGVEEDNSQTKAGFMFQLSPVGIELGKSLAFYAEAGIGATGTLQAGLRYRF